MSFRITALDLKNTQSHSCTYAQSSFLKSTLYKKKILVI
ncbi:hypothetical protein SPONN_1603 [uncultured Candidatus Thioglobus sp.]|nr:hypothetical protein SPONN_1603 [uncultured Candidatus Thioglobus sp.]